MVHTVQHGSKNTFMPEIFFNMVNLGLTGVQLFFVISAFTLFLSLSNRKNDKNKHFFLRRYFRIFPMYYVGILLYAITCYVDYKNRGLELSQFQGFTLYEVAANVFFIHGINPDWINNLVPGGWSITVEMTFYMFVPILFKYVKNLNHSVYFLIMTILFQILTLIIFKNNSYWNRNDFLYFFFPNQLPVFAFGILTYFIIKEDQPINKYKILMSGTIIFIFLSFISLYFFDFVFKDIRPIICGLFFSIFIVICSKVKSIFITNIFLKYMGKISFSLYIIHFFVLDLLEKYDLINFISINNQSTAICNYFLRLFFIIIIASTLASITYFLIESPFQEFAKKIIIKNKNTGRLTLQ